MANVCDGTTPLTSGRVVISQISLSRCARKEVLIIYTQTTRVEILCIDLKLHCIKFDLVGEWPTTMYIQISWTDLKE